MTGGAIAALNHSRGILSVTKLLLPTAATIVFSNFLRLSIAMFTSSAVWCILVVETRAVNPRIPDCFAIQKSWKNGLLNPRYLQQL